MMVRSTFRLLPPVVGAYRFCSLRHASNGVFRELATMPLASETRESHDCALLAPPWSKSAGIPDR